MLRGRWPTAPPADSSPAHTSSAAEIRAKRRPCSLGSGAARRGAQGLAEDRKKVTLFGRGLIEAYDLSVGFVALPLLIAAAAQVIGSYAAGFVATRSYRVVLMSITTAVGGVCVFIFFAVDFGLWPAVALATAGSGLLSVLAPVMVAATTEYSGDSKATGASTIGVGNFVGGVLGAGLSGALLASAGYEGIGCLCLALTTGSALLLTVFAKQLRVNTG